NYEIISPNPNPYFTATPDSNSVKLDWNAVSNAQKYAVCSYTDGAWKTLVETTDTSYTLTGLTGGKNYQLAVIAMFDGAWYTDYSKAVTVTPKTSQYPVVTTEISGRQFRLKWTAVSGAEKYGIAAYQSGGWRVKVQMNGNVTTYTSPKMKRGTYKLVVCAKVNGNWDTSKLNSRAFTITI
nr:fibronectin type III domain-containing protein [Ruminococcus sp.]